MIDTEKHPIIVLGVERSGTSVVAEMVYRWGAYAGVPETLHEADAHAPRGYWEFLPLWDLLAELGDFAAGATWWDRDFQQRIEDKAADPVYRTKATELISQMQKGYPWFWKGIWREAIYIITVRNPLDSAVSWQKFIMPSNVKVRISFVAMNLLRWQHIMTQILQQTEEAQHRLFLGYEDIMRNPRMQAERLTGFLNSKFGNQGSPIQAMVDAVEPKLWRNDCGIPFEQAPEATPEQKSLYTFVREKIENPFKPFDVTKYPLPPGHFEFLSIQEALLKACCELEALSDA